MLYTGIQIAVQSVETTRFCKMFKLILILVAFVTWVQGLTVSIRSEGCNWSYCGWATIKVNGRDYARKGTGHNVVVVDHKTGTVEQARSFNTHSSSYGSYHLATFLRALEPGKIVLVAIQGDGFVQLHGDAKRELAKIGSKGSYSYYGSQALLGYTALSNSQLPSFVQEVTLAGNKGASVISTTVIPPYGSGTPKPPTRPPTDQPPDGSCGKSGFLQRVIGGDDALPGAWPWQIGLLVDGRFSCGGTLVHEQWVVTAAHCIDRSIHSSRYTVLLGAHNRYDPQPHEQRIKAAKIVVHQRYNSPTPISNDIAMIKLSRPATLSSRVALACLPSHNYQLPLSSTCYITGWGKIQHPGNSHHILQQALLPPVEQEECKRKLAASPDGHGMSITDVMLCAGKTGTILSGCHGDSGGPYVCRDGSNRFVLHGVVSWGSPRCSAQEQYTVFARVAKFRDWIDQNISRG